MPLDILFVAAVVFALYKGYTRGFVVGIFSFLAYLMGLAAAVKLSSSVAAYLIEKYPGASSWWPVLSFLLVFIAVVIIVQLMARLIRSVLKNVSLGWLDRIGGVLMFLLIYIFIFSILVFYAEGMGWITPSVKEKSVAYRLVSPVAPAMIGFLGKILPVFKNLFDILKTFFEGLGTKFS